MEASDTRRIRLAVAGAGLIAQVIHLPTLDRLRDHFEVVALADPSVRVRDRVAARHGIPATQADHRSLLELDVDAVLVCAPNGLHAEIVLDALDAGCHVLVEKPLCLTVRDAERIVERRDETGLVVQVGYMKRFDPAYEALAEDLRATVACIRHASALTVDPGLPAAFAPPGFVRPVLDAAAAQRLESTTARQVAAALGVEASDHVAAFSGAFLGALVHDVNLGLGLLGGGESEAIEVLDAFADPAGTLAGGTVALGDGTRWTMAWALEPGAGRFEEELRLIGDDGTRTLTFGAPYLRQTSATLRIERSASSLGSATTQMRSYADAYLRQLEHFSACITRGARCRTPPEQARADVDLLTRMYLATMEVGTPA